MEPLSRRTFLARTGITAAGVGLVSVMPSITSAVDGGAEAAAPEAEDAGAGVADLANGEQVIAHVRDAATGEMDLYVGTRQIAYQDPQLVRTLLRAAR
jgi:hypothetical protein